MNRTLIAAVILLALALVAFPILHLAFAPCDAACVERNERWRNP